MKTAYRYFNNIIAAIISVQIAGCGLITMDAKPERPPVNPNSAASIDTPLVSANDSLLAMMRYLQFISKLDKEQLNDEFKRINDAYFIRPNERSALKRAMLLMRRDAEFYDRNQASQVLNDMISKEDNTTPAFKDYAKLLLWIIKMQEVADQRYTELEAEKRQEALRRKKAEEQLEALKSIEESIIQRK